MNYCSTVSDYKKTYCWQSILSHYVYFVFSKHSKSEESKSIQPSAHVGDQHNDKGKIWRGSDEEAHNDVDGSGGPLEHHQTDVARKRQIA